VSVEVLDNDITKLEVDAIANGVGGFPLEEAARIEIDEVFRYLGAGGSAIERVVFAVRGDEARQAFERTLSG
jgi:O-acetyl-ADP-ribose deacetylase (regulator of RNase III)